jgi:hypothetical protein
MGKNTKDHNGLVEVFCRYITRNGKRIYPKNAKFFHFWVKPKR